MAGASQRGEVARQEGVASTQGGAQGHRRDTVLIEYQLFGLVTPFNLSVYSKTPRQWKGMLLVPYKRTCSLFRVRGKDRRTRKSGMAANPEPQPGVIYP